MDTDADVDEHKDDSTGLDESHIEGDQSSSDDASTASKSIEEPKTPIVNDEATSGNRLDAEHQPIQIDDDKPLNLTTNCWDKPLDLSLKISK